MNINNKVNLFLTDIYSYDITSCHYNILKKSGIDISHIDPTNKIQRNTQIGLMMRSNPRIVNILRSITISTIDEYLLKNDIKEDDIIIRQYDGIILKKRIKETPEGYTPLELKNFFQSFLISIDRNKYIAYDGNIIKIKGVPYLYNEMREFLNQLIKINFLNKKSIFKSLEKIKNDILTNENPFLYCIPVNDDSEENFTIFLKDYGEVPISKSMAHIIDVSEIDKMKYFEHYIRPFTESITLEFIKG